MALNPTTKKLKFVTTPVDLDITVAAVINPPELHQYVDVVTSNDANGSLVADVTVQPNITTTDKTGSIMVAATHAASGITLTKVLPFIVYARAVSSVIVQDADSNIYSFDNDTIFNKTAAPTSHVLMAYVYPYSAEEVSMLPSNPFTWSLKEANGAAISLVNGTYTSTTGVKLTPTPSTINAATIELPASTSTDIKFIIGISVNDLATDKTLSFESNCTLKSTSQVLPAFQDFYFEGFGDFVINGRLAI